MRRSLSVVVLLLTLIGSALPVSRAGLAQSQVYSDSMDSADTGLLSTETFDPAISFTYANSQFVVNVQQPSYRGDVISTLKVPELASSRLTVDASIEGVPANKYVIAGCRHTDAGAGYFFGYLPATGDILLWRRDATGDTNIAQSVEPSLIAPANTTFQIGIDCWTNVITGIVNGQPVLSAFDATYETGRPAIGLGANGLQTDGLRVAFDNLTVTDNGNLELGAANTVTPAQADPSAIAPTVVAPTVALPTVAPPTVAAPAVTEPDVETVQSVPIADPNVDPDGTLGDAFTISLEQPPVVSGLGEDRTLDLGALAMQPAGVQLADFYAELYFTTPALPPDTSYLIGFCFWTDQSGNCYDLYIQDMGAGAARWGYGYDQLDAEYQSLQVGDMPEGSLDPAPGATNFLSLTVYQGVAILSGNTFSAGAVVTLESDPVAGDVNAETAFLDLSSTAETPPLTVSISDFAVWDLSSGMVPVVEDTSAVATQPTHDPAISSGPTLPPLQVSSDIETLFDQTRTAAVLNPPFVEGFSGAFTQEQDVYAYVPADVSLGDFYTIATFTNPDDVSAPFDIGIGFRADAGPDSGLRFVVTSDGSWYMQVPGQDPYANGTAAGFVIEPGATNVLEVLVQGSTATVAINGVLLPQFDLATVMTRGDVYLGAGFFQGDSIAGRTISYSDWWLFPTDMLDIPSG
jgi:hypothetical protein